MSYLYYPGCSLKATGRAYDESMLAVGRRLGISLPAIEDWNCCGATAYMAISELKAFALCARNFALAEKQMAPGEAAVDIVAPCAACYLGLNKAVHYLSDYPQIREKIDMALDAASLRYTHRVRIRHPLDLFIHDVGVEKIAALVRQPLTGLRVACYYGCQIVRPYAEFDDQQDPVSMDEIMAALGAEVIDWPLKTRCCGGALTGTVPDVGQRLSHLLLKEAQRRRCDLIVTACPLCQFNLECYQEQLNRRFGTTIHIAVVYFTQAMGMALGVGVRDLGLQRLFVPWPSPGAQAAAPPPAVQGGVHVQG
jgi:heterodisulfide reductase subunit B2